MINKIYGKYFYLPGTTVELITYKSFSTHPKTFTTTPRCQGSSAAGDPERRPETPRFCVGLSAFCLFWGKQKGNHSEIYNIYYYIYIYTIWLFNIAMGNPLYMEVLMGKSSIIYIYIHGLYGL